MSEGCFSKREVFKYLKRRYILNLAIDKSKRLVIYAPIRWSPLICGEFWAISLDQFSFGNHGIEEKAASARSRLVASNGHPDDQPFIDSICKLYPEINKVRFFDILLNSDIVPDCTGMDFSDPGSIDLLEECLVGISHELHFLDDHITLRLNMSAEDYENYDTGKFRNPVTFLDYNLLCSMRTTCSVLNQVEEKLCGRVLFTTISEYKTWFRDSADYRTGWQEFCHLMNEKNISVNCATTELSHMLRLLDPEFGGLPRTKDGTIDLDLITQFEDGLDSNQSIRYH